MLDAILLAAATRSSGSTNWGLIAALATAGAALVALVLREMQQRRENLDQKVASAVSAGLGRTLLEFRQMEEGAKKTLNDVLANAGRIEHQLGELLKGSETHAARLTELLGEAADVVPQVAEARTAIPALLIQQAQTAAPDAAAGYLVALLNSGVASADLLTSGGNIAVGRLGATALALQLYAKAVQVNPRNADAAASAIRLRTIGGQLSLEEGLTQITEVVRGQPNDRNAVSEALNLFTHARDFQGMLDFVEELLKSGEGNQALLWRNRSIALSELRKPRDQVIESYQRSFELAIESGSGSETANTARPYAAFLRRMRHYDAARSVVRMALRGDPRSVDLLVLLAELEAEDGKFTSARWCLDFAGACAVNPSDIALVQDTLADLDARRMLFEQGILATDDEQVGEPGQENGAAFVGSETDAPPDVLADEE